MASILFVTWDGGGNVPPAVGIARELQRRGHAVRVLGQGQQRAALESAGLPFEAYSRTWRWSAAAPKRGTVGFLLAVTDVMSRRVGEEMLAAVRQEPTDLVVVDVALDGAIKAAAAAGLRRAVLVHSFVAIGRPHRGARRTGPWAGADLGLVATLRDLDPGGGIDSPSVRYTGPIWQDEPAPAQPPAGVPRVLVSLSTCWFPRQTTVLQNILDAVAGMAADAVVTTGPAVDPASLRAASNVELHRYLRHADVLPTVSLVVGHGGHATTMAALAHDLPVVVLPMHRIMDQRAIGLAVQKSGAGRLLPKMSPPDRIRQTVEDLLADGPHRAAAAMLGARIRGRDGAGVAADHLTELLG